MQTRPIKGKTPGHLSTSGFALGQEHCTTARINDYNLASSEKLAVGGKNCGVEMLRSELDRIIANGENSGVEFKRDDCRAEQLAREIVAMVNLNGGMVLLGVEDDGTISGIERKNSEEWVMDTVVARKIHPLILPFYEEIQIDDQKRVAVISFTQGVAKPYVLRHNNREDIYIRIGSTSRLATREQQARL